ncbi:S-Ena type endospore appendage [Bacillus sp. 165]|uniref:S-Ena type endospore appendage n=1 Tax=Bacillus sp. 165 TaxID=1529117 RepID=UPI001ADAE3A7|nr:S-Ena type endospore appendage [Bacillus sp. 165]MBO9129852.1 hypothetical protein [Bacillus sp. 165]
MCGSKGNCCPDRVVFQEKICGNLTGSLGSAEVPFIAWQGPAVNDYFQGTFEIFNAGPGIINANVLDINGGSSPINVPSGNSVAVSVNNPAALRIVSVPAGTHGKFCITLYKAIFA